MTTRVADEGCLQDCLRVRSSWVRWFRKLVPQDLLWCPAECPVPRLEDEETVRAHLLDPQSALWGVVWEDQGHVQGYLLCRSEEEHGRLAIISQSPRISERVDFATVGGELISCALTEGARRGLSRADLFFHGPSVEISALVELYRHQGFAIPSGSPRLEMIRHRSLPIPEAASIQLRSASDVGLSAFFEADAAIRGVSADQSREDLEFSKRMWIIDPNTDWMLAYDNSEVAGVVETAVTKSGVGVIDHLEVKEDCRGRGYGRSLLAYAVAHLASRSEFIWLDVDRDNAPALRLYQRAGFVVHHEHGSLYRAGDAIRPCRG